MHERDEERDAREVEEDRHRADGERDRQELPDRQRAEPPGNRDRRERERPEQVGDDHVLAPMGAPVDPDARRQREEQVRKPGERRQDPDLERRRVQREHGGQRNRERADLVAEDGDRLARPEPDEGRLPGKRRLGRRLRGRPRCFGGYGHQARRIAMSPLMAVALISTSGPSPSDGASVISSSELVSPLIERRVDEDLRALLDGDLDVPGGGLER